VQSAKYIIYPLIITFACFFFQEQAYAVDAEALAKKVLCHTCLAKIYVAQGKTSEAITEYQELLKLTPNDASAHFEFAGVLARNGKTDIAAPQYKLAAKLKPNVAEYQAGLGYALMCTKSYEAAVAAYSKACVLGGKYQEQLQNAQQYQAQQKLLEQYKNKMQAQQESD
jgi:Flp pilus assembly protein TadD